MSHSNTPLKRIAVRPARAPAAVTDLLLFFIRCYQIPVSARMAIAADVNRRQREVLG
jgi:hypothetical protein